MYSFSEGAHEAKTFYDEALKRAKYQKHVVERLLDTAQMMADQQSQITNHMVARYHRISVQQPHTNPTDFWAHHYVAAIQQPNPELCHRALARIAVQTAQSDGSHHPDDAAVFTAALFNLIGPANLELQVQGYSWHHHYLTGVNWLNTIIRTGHTRLLPQNAWHMMLNTMAPLVTEQALYLYPHWWPKAEGRSRPYDHLGRINESFIPIADFMAAHRIVDEAASRAIVHWSEEPYQTLKHIFDDKIEQWTSQSLAHDPAHSIADSYQYHLANINRITPEQLHEINITVQSFIDNTINRSKHQYGRITNPNNGQDVPEFAPTRQKEQALFETLQDMSNRTISRNIPPYARNKEPGVPTSRGPHQDKPTHLEMIDATIVYAGQFLQTAATISDPAAVTIRDAMIFAALGRINQRIREHYQPCRRFHTHDVSDELFTEHIGIASTIVSMMPDQILHPHHRETILQRDQHDQEKHASRRLASRPQYIEQR